MTEDINKIIAHSFEYAQDLINDTKEFYPFGAYIDTVHNVHPLEFDPDTKNQPQVKTVLDSLTKYCEGEMNESKMLAYSLTYEAELVLEEGSEPVTCIAVDITDKDNSELPVFYKPFRFNEEGEVIFDEPFAVKK